MSFYCSCISLDVSLYLPFFPAYWDLAFLSRISPQPPWHLSSFSLAMTTWTVMPLGFSCCVCSCRWHILTIHLALVISSDNLNFIILSVGHRLNITLLSQLSGRGEDMISPRMSLFFFGVLKQNIWSVFNPTPFLRRVYVCLSTHACTCAFICLCMSSLEFGVRFLTQLLFTLFLETSSLAELKTCDTARLAGHQLWGLSCLCLLAPGLQAHGVLSVVPGDQTHFPMLTPTEQSFQL